MRPLTDAATAFERGLVCVVADLIYSTMRDHDWLERKRQRKPRLALTWCWKIRIKKRRGRKGETE